MKSDTVFLLGSGFSKDIAEFPTLQELSKSVSSSLQQGITDSKTAPSFLNLISSITLPGPIMDNIEYLMSYFFQDYPWRNQKEKHISKFYYYLIAEIIEREFLKLERANLEKAYANEWVRKLIQYWHEKQLTVIAFNYDTLIERLALKCFPDSENQKGMWWSDLYYQIPIKYIKLEFGTF